MKRAPVLASCALLLWGSSCYSSGQAGRHRAEAPAAEAPALPPVNPRFAEDVARIARAYVQLGRLDDLGRWAPTFCELPITQARVSETGDAAAHGQKLYTLYVKDPASYAGFPPSMLAGEQELAEFEQVVVKEAWVPAPWEGTAGEVGAWPGPERWGPSGLRPAERDGRFWWAKERADLYVMYRLDPDTPGTDQGWVYGTVAPDRATVRAAGVIESCADCHGTEEDRLFGPVRYDGWKWR